MEKQQQCSRFTLFELDVASLVSLSLLSHPASDPKHLLTPCLYSPLHPSNHLLLSDFSLRLLHPLSSLHKKGRGNGRYYVRIRFQPALILTPEMRSMLQPERRLLTQTRTHKHTHTCTQSKNLLSSIFICA